MASPGLYADSAVRPPWGDVEIDFQNPPFRQHQIDPKRQWKLQSLTDEAAARPEEQVFGGLLGDGRATPCLGDVFSVLDRRPQLGPVDAVMRTKPTVFGRDDGT